MGTPTSNETYPSELEFYRLLYGFHPTGNDPATDNTVVSENPDSRAVYYGRS